MSFEAELDALARRLAPRGPVSRAVMVHGISPSAGASTIAAALAETVIGQGVDPVWLYDLDFRDNPQAERAALNGQAYSGQLAGRQFWRTHPEQAGRLALRRVQGRPLFVSRFERAPGQIRTLSFMPDSSYWREARRRAALTLVDAPHNSPALRSVAADMDGVILVADARRDTQLAANAAAARLSELGAHVLGVVVNRASGS